MSETIPLTAASGHPPQGFMRLPPRKRVLIALTRIIESVVSAIMTVIPIVFLCLQQFDILNLAPSIFLIINGVLILFGAYKFRFMGRFFGFLLDDMMRGIYHIILGFLMYRKFDAWYTTFMSVGGFVGVFVGILLLIQKCVVG